jgi:myotubularin-related protein 6/7/8
MNGRIQPSPSEPEFAGPVSGSDEDPGQMAASSSSSLPPMSSQTLSLPGSTSRSTSPSVEGGLRDLSLSAPSLSAPATIRPSNNSPGPSQQRSSSPASSPIWGRAKPPDLIAASAGVKSMWGKLSSNATAAFSAVQDVYAGVAKDLNNNYSGNDADNSNHSGGSQTTSELRGREALRAWGEEGESVSSRSPGPTSLPSLTLTNPWASTAPRSRTMGPSIIDSNPWGSAFSGSPRAERSQATMPSTKTAVKEPLSALPMDPTVSMPTPRAEPTPKAEPNVAPIPSREHSAPAQSPAPGEAASGSFDPLGVGLR